MSLLLLWESYDEAYKIRMHLVEGLPLTHSAWQTVLLTALYLILVTRVGPWLMAAREPFQLRRMRLAYNACQVVLCSYVVTRSMLTGWFWMPDLVCLEFERSSIWNELATVAYVYYITKYIDWIDTFIFVARKQFQHVSTLQLFHHAIMPVMFWVVALWCPIYFGFLIITSNSFVHVFLYAYYFMATLGNSTSWLRKWKRYLTVLQICQLVMLLAVHSWNLLTRDCLVFGLPAILSLLFGAALLFLFLRFYQHQYILCMHPKID